MTRQPVQLPIRANCMTLGHLMEKLKNAKIADDTEIWISSDPEGNDIRPVMLVNSSNAAVLHESVPPYRSEHLTPAIPGTLAIVLVPM